VGPLCHRRKKEGRRKEDVVPLYPLTTALTTALSTALSTALTTALTTAIRMNLVWGSGTGMVVIVTVKVAVMGAWGAWEGEAA
jgi:hypothetical protein